MTSGSCSSPASASSTWSRRSSPPQAVPAVQAATGREYVRQADDGEDIHSGKPPTPVLITSGYSGGEDSVLRVYEQSVLRVCVGDVQLSGGPTLGGAVAAVVATGGGYRGMAGHLVEQVEAGVKEISDPGPPEVVG